MAKTVWTVCRSTAKCVVFRALGVIHKLNWRAGRSSISVLLTFDDGPHPDVTPGVLDLLKKYDALAVFFVVGNRIPFAPDLLARISAEGHLIGNHSFEHWLGRPPWPLGYVRDVQKCQEVIEALTGQRPRLFRPPLGGVSVASWLAARVSGLSLVHWSLDSGDWRLRRQDDAAARGEELSRLVSDKDIILFHDDNPCVLRVLDVLLPSLKAQGFDMHSPVKHLNPASHHGQYDATVA